MVAVDLVDAPVRVSVPATSANLGPGFDSLGLALDLRDELEAEVLDGGLEIEVEGVGADDVPRDATHLVVRSMHAAFDRLGIRPPGLRLHCRNVVPHARGLGSSSAAIVAGVVLARGLVRDGEERLDDDGLLSLAADLEGHPDNVAPALLGGLRVCGRDDDGWYAAAAPVADDLGAVVLVPPTPVSTEAARGLLPASVPHADAAANSGRAALLVAALAGDRSQLLRGTRDLLHQDYRRPAMAASVDLVHALRAEGVPAVVSGAGPTVLAFTDADRTAAVESLLAACPDGWEAAHLALDTAGARLLGR